MNDVVKPHIQNIERPPMSGEETNRTPLQQTEATAAATVTEEARPPRRTPRRRHEEKVESRNVSLKKRSVFPLEYSFYHTVIIASIGLALFGIQLNWERYMGKPTYDFPNYNVGYWCGAFCLAEAVFCMLTGER